MAKVYRDDRRKFLRTGAILGTALVAGTAGPVAQATNGTILQSDIDILRFLAALEILETDLWQQYNELGGIQDPSGGEVPGGSGNKFFTTALKKLDADMPQ